jgi:hypothetical protein
MNQFLNNRLLKTSILAAAALCLAAPAMADTFQAPASAQITATERVDGSVQLSWTGVQFSAVELYVGHGQRGGYVSRVNLGAATSYIVPPGTTDRLNFVGVSGVQFLHLECGDNDRTTQPRLVGLTVDCSFTGATGGAEGALVITTS